MSLGMDDVRRIAELAHIDIDDEQEEIEEYSNEKVREYAR